MLSHLPACRLSGATPSSASQPASKASVWKRLCLILASCYLHGTWNEDSGGEYKPLRTERTSVTLCAFCDGAETCLTL